ncbi:hypothetical protein IC582_016257 [Cucumis melo]
MLNDLQAPIEHEEEIEEFRLEDEMAMNVGVNIDEDTTNNIFQDLLNQARNELYPGCFEFLSLNFLVKLMDVKVLNGWSNKSFDMLLELLRAAFPMCNSTIPSSFYEAKRKLRDLGLGYETIHACKYDCVLYWKEFADLQHCPTCGEARYKVNHNIGKKILHKVLRHFPLEPRLQRLFVSQEGSADMRWHRDKRVETDDVLRHPANAEGWKHFDSEFPDFASDPRNVHLGLALDGFNPFGQMSTSHSMWPVLYAALLWTINDFPVYGDLSGWSMKGYQACPICMGDRSSFGIRGRISFMGHRRYLLQNHVWRRSRLHDGKVERKAPPVVMNGDEILEQLDQLEFPVMSKHPSIQDKKRKRALNWTKKSIFFNLPYWSRLLLRHKLDVMHIEKNVCDNLVGTLLNIEGKMKDTTNARLDLQDLKMRKDLHLVEVGNRLVKPHASYTLTTSERVEFCKFLKSVKFPDGFVSNISRCVHEREGKISGLKTHDCHVLLHRLLPIGIRAFLPKNVYTAITELCNFFRDLCTRTIRVSDLDRLQADIIIILCKLERIFLPAFFSVMVHLAVHIPYETKITGPVSYSWMYPIERILRTLKQYVRNKARPEGSIAEGYVMNESSTFCSRYLRGIETRFTRDERNDDTIVENEVIVTLKFSSRKYDP